MIQKRHKIFYEVPNSYLPFLSLQVFWLGRSSLALLWYNLYTLQVITKTSSQERTKWKEVCTPNTLRASNRPSTRTKCQGSLQPPLTLYRFSTMEALTLIEKEFPSVNGLTSYPTQSLEPRSKQLPHLGNKSTSLPMLKPRNSLHPTELLLPCPSQEDTNSLSNSSFEPRSLPPSIP